MGKTMNAQIPRDVARALSMSAEEVMAIAGHSWRRLFVAHRRSVDDLMRYGRSE